MRIENYTNSGMTVSYTGDLEQNKSEALHLIDLNTSSNILNGFVYDNKTFSMSLSAQINWSNLLNIPSNMFPLALSTKDDEEIYSLEYANLQAFYSTALNYKNSLLQAGNDLKQQVKNCTTIPEVWDLIG